MKMFVLGLFALVGIMHLSASTVFAYHPFYGDSGAFPIVAGTVYTPIPQGVVYEPQYKIVREVEPVQALAAGEKVAPKAAKTADLVSTNELHFYNVPHHQVYKIYGRSGRNIRIKR